MRTPTTSEVVIATAFAAVVIALAVWLFWKLLKKSTDPKTIFIKSVISLPLAVGAVLFGRAVGPAGPFVMVLLAIILSLMWTPHLADFIFRPITGLFDGGTQEPEKRPLYSIARAKQKRGNYTEAIADARAQLAKFPTDFEGQMLIAEIQAEGQHDLQSADVTVQRFINQKGHVPNEIIYALNALADWYLKYAQDVDSARMNLEKIIERFPESEFALAATQRLSHLGESRRVIMERRDHRKIEVPEGIKDMGLMSSGQHIKPVEIPPEQQAADCVKHLEEHPLDMEVREKLAAIYANHYQRLDLATDQLEQMIQTRGQPPKNIVRWLNLLADFQVKLTGNYDTVRQTLERIVEIAPDFASANLARTRISYLRLQLKGQNDPNRSMKLGTYEQDIGLKGVDGKYPSNS